MTAYIPLPSLWDTFQEEMSLPTSTILKVISAVEMKEGWAMHNMYPEDNATSTYVRRFFSLIYLPLHQLIYIFSLNSPRAVHEAAREAKHHSRDRSDNATHTSLQNEATTSLSTAADVPAIENYMRRHFARYVCVFGMSTSVSYASNYATRVNKVGVQDILLALEASGSRKN